MRSAARPGLGAATWPGLRLRSLWRPLWRTLRPGASGFVSDGTCCRRSGAGCRRSLGYQRLRRLQRSGRLLWRLRRFCSGGPRPVGRSAAVRRLPTFKGISVWTGRLHREPGTGIFGSEFLHSVQDLHAHDRPRGAQPVSVHFCATRRGAGSPATRSARLGFAPARDPYT
jgi:hypothetical protein